MRTGKLVLNTTNNTTHHFEMFVFSWVNSAGTVNSRNFLIEISARNNEVGQVLFHIKTTGKTEGRKILSDFHDKLLTALASSLDVQITAYTSDPVLPKNLVEVNLEKNLVYLIVS